MTDKETFDKFDLIKEVERLRSENEALKEELAEVYKKIDDLHQWHLSHL